MVLIPNQSKNMLTFDTARLLCSRYRLGAPTATPQPVAGGLIHRMYHLSTTEGRFAVKVLDQQIMQTAGIREEFRRSERIAAAFADADVPAVLALEAPGGTVQDLAGMTVIVYPWCDGFILPKSAASPTQAAQIGAILGRIHALDLRLPGEALTSSLPMRKPIPQQNWEALVNRGREQDIEWASALAAALPDLFRWDKEGIEAEKLLPPGLVISHCDLDQKNVLWRDRDTPVVIDWESAGATRPAAEVIGAALDWSGQSAGPPDRAAFAAVIAGYRQRAEFPSEIALLLLQARLADWAGWLGANMRRSFGDEIASDEQVALGVRETTNTLATMYALDSGMEAWAKWCC